ncbi:hypothetical protein [Tahibacter harae]|uniref:Delta-60 repeat protein n=1 Tax=Tahibacter harae TaxID=2963937 RepID=A0ABT1QLC7_9GAMM|nr:hypothetical protein [Tahibacter harae]MCQ4163331.1 hypothetical protein [Tahibacter harae]
MQSLVGRLVLAAAALVPGLAAAGNINYDAMVDTSFATTTSPPYWRRLYTTGTVDERAIAVARMPDRSIVALISVPGGAVGSKIGLQRYNANGSPFSGVFGSAGKVVKDAYLITLTGMIADSQGRIVVIGSTPGPGGKTDFGVVRFNGDGSDDTSFGGDGGVAVGMEPLPNAGDDYPVAIIEQPTATGSRLVIAGNTSMTSGSSTLHRFGLIGLRQDGSIDPDFGNYVDPDYAGRVNDRYVSGQDAYASSLVLMPNSSLLIAGATVQNSTDTDYGACYLSPNGAPFADFSSCIRVAIDEPGPGGSLYDSVTAMAVSRPDRITLVGNSSGRISATRLLLEGSHLGLDPTFLGSNITGREYLFVHPSTGTYANDAALRSDGSLIIAGRYNDGSRSRAAVHRLRPNGSSDTMGYFSPTGFIVTEVPAFSTSGNSFFGEFNKVLIDSGKPLLLGTASDSTTAATDLDGVLVRLYADLIFADGLQPR